MTPANQAKAVQRHLAKAREALADSEVLLAADRFDAASSRVYYCCFHAAKAALVSEGVQPRTHKGVNERFNLDLVSSGKIEAEYLSVLGRVQSHRESADYDVETVMTSETARGDTEAARRFLERVRRFLNEVPASSD